MLLEEDNQDPVAAMNTKKLVSNGIAAAIAANSGIKNTTGVYHESDAPTPIFKVNPTPDVEPDSEHEDSKNYDYDDDGVMLMTMTKLMK